MLEHRGALGRLEVMRARTSSFVCKGDPGSHHCSGRDFWQVGTKKCCFKVQKPKTWSVPCYARLCQVSGSGSCVVMVSARLLRHAPSQPEGHPAVTPHTSGHGERVCCLGVWVRQHYPNYRLNMALYVIQIETLLQKFGEKLQTIENYSSRWKNRLWKIQEAWIWTWTMPPVILPQQSAKAPRWD